MFQIHSTKLRRIGASLATLAVGAVAATATWHHISAVGAKYGETMSAFLPISIDGMMVAGVLLAADAKATGRPVGSWARVATWPGAVLSIAAQVESGRDRGLAAALIATVFSITLIVTVEALFYRPQVRQMTKLSEAPTSPGMPASPEYDDPAALAYREAAERLRRESRLAGLNTSE